MDAIDIHHREALLPMSAERLSPARRMLDVAFALTLLVLLLPLLVLLALLVRVTSGAPVLFRQPRVGAGGREFTLLKFRSMRQDSAGPEVTSSCDRRVTGLGRLLRRLSLDELPQLWNVLRGDMTLAGPRPEVPHLAERYPRSAGGCSGTAPVSPGRASSAPAISPGSSTTAPIRRSTT